MTGLVPSNYVEANGDTRDAGGGGGPVMTLLCVYEYSDREASDNLDMQPGDSIRIDMRDQSEAASNDAWWHGENLRTGLQGQVLYILLSI